MDLNAKLLKAAHADKSSANLCAHFDVAITSAHIWIACSSPISCYQVLCLYEHNVNHANLSIRVHSSKRCAIDQHISTMFKTGEVPLKIIKCTSLEKVISLIHYE